MDDVRQRMKRVGRHLPRPSMDCSRNQSTRHADTTRDLVWKLSSERFVFSQNLALMLHPDAYIVQNLLLYVRDVPGTQLEAIRKSRHKVLGYRMPAKQVLSVSLMYSHAAIDGCSRYDNVVLCSCRRLHQEVTNLPSMTFCNNGLCLYVDVNNPALYYILV